MPDQDFTITLAADIASFTSGMNAAAEAAGAAAEEIQGSFADSGVERVFESMAEAAQSSMAEIEARFAASGAVIRDYANEIQNAGFVEASAAERTVALNQEVQAQRAATFSTMRDEFDGTAEAQRAQAAEMEEAAQREAAALKEIEAQAEASAMTFGKMKTAFWDLWTAMFAVDMVVGVFKGMADEVMKLGDSVRMTSVELGVSNNQARAFNETMESLGVSSTTVSSAIRKLMADVSNGGKELARLKDATGSVVTENRSGLDIFEQVVTKINNISDSTQRAEAAYQLLGRGGMQLLGVLQQIPGALNDAIAAQDKNSAANDAAVQQSLALHKALTDLKSAWDDDVINIAPAIVGALQGIGFALKQVGDDSEAAVRGLQDFAAAAMNAVQAAIAFAAHNLPLGEGEGSTGGQDAITALKTHQEQYGAGFQPMGEEGVGIGPSGAGSWAPKPGPKGRGGDGGADPMAGMDNALDKANDEMAKFNSEFGKLGSEASMAAKEGGQSFDQLRDKATQDYQVMQQKYKEFTDAIDSGSKQAAQQADQAWHLAAQHFQTDWEQAKQKATQDMQQIKGAANQMASEVSGILNNAISGKLNWAQEFDKILSQMLDKLIKHLFQQIAMWAANEMQVNAIKQAGATTGLAIQKEANVAAGTSDAVTAAKGAYSSAAQIPYIGWIIAPVAAAAAFAGVEAFGSAEGGWDIPAGVHPVAQLHPSEMVLPASLAENVRKMTSSGGGANTSVTQNIHAIDSRSFLDIVDSNHQGIAQAVAKARRGGARFNTG